MASKFPWSYSPPGSNMIFDFDSRGDVKASAIGKVKLGHWHAALHMMDAAVSDGVMYKKDAAEISKSAPELLTIAGGVSG